MTVLVIATREPGHSPGQTEAQSTPPATICAGVQPSPLSPWQKLRRTCLVAGMFCAPK
jgi:hypothetical protein